MWLWMLDGFQRDRLPSGMEFVRIPETVNKLFSENRLSIASSYFKHMATEMEIRFVAFCVANCMYVLECVVAPNRVTLDPIQHGLPQANFYRSPLSRNRDDINRSVIVYSVHATVRITISYLSLAGEPHNCNICKENGPAHWSLHACLRACVCARTAAFYCSTHTMQKFTPKWHHFHRSSQHEHPTTTRKMSSNFFAMRCWLSPLSLL